MVKKKGDERMNNKELVEKIMKEFKVSDIVVNGGINLSGFEKALNRMAEEKNKESCGLLSAMNCWLLFSGWRSCGGWLLPC